MIFASERVLLFPGLTVFCCDKCSDVYDFVSGLVGTLVIYVVAMIIICNTVGYVYRDFL